MDKAKDIKKQVDKVKDKVEKIKEQYDQAAAIVGTAEEVATSDYSNFTEADYVRLAAQIAGLADPTGIAGTIENFSHPKCSQIFKKWSVSPLLMTFSLLTFEVLNFAMGFIFLCLKW